MSERECLNRHEGGCVGPVEGRPSLAGTGTEIHRCTGHHEAAVRHAEEIRERYPDSPNPPDWFDPTYAGERWDDDY